MSTADQLRQIVALMRANESEPAGDLYVVIPPRAARNLTIFCSPRYDRAGGVSRERGRRSARRRRAAIAARNLWGVR